MNKTDPQGDLLSLDRDRRLAEIHGTTITLTESRTFPRWYFSYDKHALYVARLIPLACMLMPLATGKNIVSVCIPDSQIDHATKAAAPYGVTLQFQPHTKD